jgi:hypothetical protein
MAATLQALAGAAVVVKKSGIFTVEGGIPDALAADGVLEVAVKPPEKEVEKLSLDQKMSGSKPFYHTHFSRLEFRTDPAYAPKAEVPVIVQHCLSGDGTLWTAVSPTEGASTAHMLVGTYTAPLWPTQYASGGPLPFNFSFGDGTSFQEAVATVHKVNTPPCFSTYLCSSLH